MWDLKLYLIYYFYFIDYFMFNLLFMIFNIIDTVYHNGFFNINWKIYYQFAQNTTIFFGIKFLLCIFFLILIRGGTPRYRYDYLTKLGWLKFISLTLLIFFSILLMFLLFN
uniref:NADH dehydrogenase subunit 1b n=1 Tax=Pseudourostyla cristata TaxID=293816 RepID=A0A4P9JLF4_9SPIT|nr:NADH dehydrogenase subunit 1b [Pseudourostyla cristata]